jgi:hypothetical protein
MEMTIDKSIEEVQQQKLDYQEFWEEYKNEHIEALDMAIDTMRKYQKIVDIVSLNDEEFKQCGLKELKEILEVITDGKTN